MKDVLTSAVAFIPISVLVGYFLYQASKRQMPLPAIVGGYVQLTLLLSLPLLVIFRSGDLTSILLNPGWLALCGLGFLVIALIGVSRRTAIVSPSAEVPPRAGWSTPYVRGEVEVSGPVEAVFKHVADPTYWDSWSAVPMNTVVTSGGPTDEGATYRETFALQGKPHSIVGTILEYRPPSFAASTCLIDEVIECDSDVSFTEAGTQAVKIVTRMRLRPLTPSRRIVMRVLWPLNYLGACSSVDKSLRSVQAAAAAAAN